MDIHWCARHDHSRSSVYRANHCAFALVHARELSASEHRQRRSGNEGFFIEMPFLNLQQLRWNENAHFSTISSFVRPKNVLTFCAFVLLYTRWISSTLCRELTTTGNKQWKPWVYNLSSLHYSANVAVLAEELYFPLQVRVEQCMAIEKFAICPPLRRKHDAIYSRWAKRRRIAFVSHQFSSQSRPSLSNVRLLPQHDRTLCDILFADNHVNLGWFIVILARLNIIQSI